MELIKRHKGLAIVLGLTLILVIIMFAIFARMIFSSGDSEYGDRLKGIASVNKEDTNKLISGLEERDEIDDVSVRTQGKIIYITITYLDSVSKDKAKEIANNTYTYYSEEVIKDYDFEYFLTQKFPFLKVISDLLYYIVGKNKSIFSPYLKFIFYMIK